MCEKIERLRELVRELPDDYPTAGVTLEDMKEVANNVTKYRLLGDKFALSYSLFDHPNISIAHTTIPKGGYWGYHQHLPPVKNEIVFMVEGEMEIDMLGEGKVKIKAGSNDFHIMNQNVIHDAYAITKVVIIAVTIPRDYGFPKGLN